MGIQKRIPKQERSKLRKEKLLITAYDLFLRNGYYNVTTNAIAQAAEVPISSLYSYFEDKEAILLDLLTGYNDYFLEKFDFTTILEKKELKDLKEISSIVSEICTILVEVHLETKEFNRELQSLYFHIPAVEQLIDGHEAKLRKVCLLLLYSLKNLLTITDYETASAICVNIISSTVDAIVLNKTSIEADRLIHGCGDAISKFLTG